MLKHLTTRLPKVLRKISGYLVFAAGHAPDPSMTTFLVIMGLAIVLILIAELL